ncbi:hypothetical protein [uncultured Methylovirgula sp.]|uniref:hypothetical protein n=1 Tax=uncultured Methylovirgula sp. TaxID=1285960 RepID=UPI00261DD530|nr:hypothetical protein [uncultured Methylovirgula sp.]
MAKSPISAGFGNAERTELLKSMGRSLSLSRLYGASKGHNSPQYKMADNLRAAIRALATDLTDDPYYYGDQVEIEQFADQAERQ